MATRTSAQSGLASATTTWVGGVVPVEGDKVIIAAGHTVTLNGTFTWGDDTDSTSIGSSAVNVSGTLKASRTVSSSLTVRGGLLVNYATHGLDFGTTADPIPDGVTATLILNKAASPSVRAGIQQVPPTNGAGNFIKWTFVGNSVRARAAKLAANATTASAVITIDTTTSGWKVGDQVLLMPTEENTVDQAEVRTISAISSATVTLNAAPTYLHKSGAPVCNLTCNVTIRSFNEVDGQSAYLAMEAGSYLSTEATAGYVYQFENARLQSLGRQYGNAAIELAEYFTGRGAQILMKGLVVYNQAFDAGLFRNVFRRRIDIQNSVLYTLGSMHSAAGNVWLTDSFYHGASVSYGTNQGNEAIRSWISGNASSSSLFGGPLKLTDCTIAGCTRELVGTEVFGLSFNNCDLGKTYGYRNLYGEGAVLMAGMDFRSVIVEVNDCLIADHLLTPATDAGVASQSESFSFLYKNKGRVATAQELYKSMAITTRNNATRNRGSSSIAIRPIQTGNPLVRTRTIPCANGASIRVIGYVRVDSAFYNGGTWTAPTVRLSGLNATPVTFTATSAANGAWQKFDLTITNSSGADGNFTLTYTVTALSALGTVYFDGVTDDPFITKVRHYGFMFDETNPARVVNPIISATEAVAGAYTGVTINAATPQITVGTGTANTWQKIYEYSQYWACVNIDNNVLITSTDGVNFNVAKTTKVSWPTMPSTGVLVGGWLLLTAGTYSISLSGTKIDFTQAGSYNLSNSNLSGTVDLVNSSGGAVTVSLPSDAVYNNLGPNITVTQATTALTVNGFVAGSDVVIYANGVNASGDGTNVLASGDAVSNSFSWTYTGTPTVDIGVFKSGYVPLVIRGIELPAGGLTYKVNQSVDRNYA